MIPCEIDSTERLGRGVFESQFAKVKTPRTRAKFYRKAFEAGPMSVDRLDYADIGRLCSIHDHEAASRRSINTFYGWYVFAAGLVRSCGMCVKYSRTRKNPWHSLVCLTGDGNEEDDALQSYFNALASETEWFPRPISPSLQRDVEEASAGLDS